MCYYLSDLRRDDNFLHIMTEEIAKEITVEEKKVHARRCSDTINCGNKLLKIKYTCENRLLLSKLFYFNVLELYAGICKW